MDQGSVFRNNSQHVERGHPSSRPWLEALSRDLRFGFPEHRRVYTSHIF
jgi:hypothetical protein